MLEGDNFYENKINWGNGIRMNFKEKKKTSQRMQTFKYFIIFSSFIKIVVDIIL